MDLEAGRVLHSVPASFLPLFELPGIINAHLPAPHGKFPGKLEL